ncbi:MAG: hypothetical protein AVDCRST_MAG83-2355 [uncultured Arthrobacter sp.]|uniref:DUF5671 domain-containing protein n=1 Tax=uncultured Arthrobacter sp. TaxID=114050 RepID=A0A6J4ILZ3_9MICC|nr:DUF5671 domain-containing protein [uncultured Arthrobacter sp.]CAA9254318.1 MAG: hypothetical protein AVDCRST_MAG83-2355 [uncultured Arthrobacter sp.]
MSTGTRAAPGRSSAQPVLRRLIVFTLLFALVLIGAGGLTGLLGRLLNAGDVLVADDVTGLARSLAFTLVGGPLAALLWWVAWRRVESERSSTAWGLYVAGIYAVSLITAATALLGTAASLIGGDPERWSEGLARGLVWTGVLLWHHWMWRHRTRGPLALKDLPLVGGYIFGLVLAVGGAYWALAGLLDAAVEGSTSGGAIGVPWWRASLAALVWAAGGAGLWLAYWMRGGGRHLRTALSNVALVLFGVLGAGLLTLGGLGTVLFVLLRLAFDRTDPQSALLSPLAPALAAAAIGAPVWVYHLRAAATRAEGTRLAGRLVTSGVSLAAAAAGVGVIVNALLAALASPVVGNDPRTLLLGGISSLAVGGPVWWFAWRPTAAPGGGERSRRRVYLVAVFGLSALVALITLLVLGYLIFEFLLADVGGAALIERVRAPLGLLLATGGTAAYHFSVWRQDRAAAGGAAPADRRAIGSVILVAGAGAEPLAELISGITGAGVTMWWRADPTPDAAVPSGEELARALDGVVGERVLVIVGAVRGIEVIPLAG